MIDFLNGFTTLFIRFFNECELAIYLVACIVIGTLVRAIIQLFKAV